MEEDVMEALLKTVLRLSRSTSVIAEVTLTIMMLLTVSDVILRSFNRPILGTYELVAFLGAVTIGFSVPITSWMRGHVNVDLFLTRSSRKVRNIVIIWTRCLGIALFLLISWRLVKYGMNLQRAAEVSMTLRMPFYPVAYGLAIPFLVQCLVLFCDILKIRGGLYD
jgi:TRAP-type C4-dicarboxylate transport system permease small subunit